LEPDSITIETALLSDPWFYAVAIPAVLLTGISKSGFGGALGVVSVPILALVVSPVQAAAILLPILCLMDLMGLWAYRGKWALGELRLLLPAALLGIAAGTLLFGVVNVAILRLVLGSMALVFAVHYWMQLKAPTGGQPPGVSRAIGIVSGAAAGFTSFIAHAGGPPLHMYLLRRSLDKTTFVATTVTFFTAVNYVKLVPYAWLGQLAVDNLKTSLVLAPLAPVGIALGIWLHKRVPDRHFFRIACLFLFVLSLKLISDGLRAL
jgi:uncharacterized membrane protein YfcA